MKSYTDIEQSRKLAEILPLESADMAYEYDVTITGQRTYSPCLEKFLAVKHDYPAWSLAALLDVLPNNKHIDTTIAKGGWKIESVEYMPNTWWCIYENNESLTEFYTSADNPVDACYEMIIKLHERNLL